MTDALTDLIRRLEHAPEGSRELDALIGGLHGIPRYDVPQFVHGDITPAPRFTDSLDAAICLVPEGHWWTAGDCKREKHARVAPEAIDNDGREGFGATVALALCIAALKARQSMEGEGVPVRRVNPPS